MISIASYHEERRLRFYYNSVPSFDPVPGVLYFGTEVETDLPPNNRGLAWNTDELEEELTECGFLPLFFPTKDGSLAAGCEFVSYPLDIKSWLHSKPTINRGFDALVRSGLRAHDTTTCGLHVHASAILKREQKKSLVTMVENNWPALSVFSRRPPNRYCSKQYDSSEHGKISLRRKEFIKETDIPYNEDDRYKGINLANRETIEFRMFKGTLNANTFYATIELVHNFMEVARFVTPDEAFQVTLQDIIHHNEFDELKKYSSTLKLSTNVEQPYISNGEEE